MAMSAEHRSNFAAVHRQWWRLHMKISRKILEWDENPNDLNSLERVYHFALIFFLLFLW